MNQEIKYSERELITLLQQRDEKAFGYLYDNYAGALIGVILPIVNDGEIANDILQEVFVNVWKKIEFYDATKGRLFTWLLNIARNAAIDKVRSKDFRNNQNTVTIAENTELNTVKPIFQPNTDFIGLKKILANLKDEYRILIDLSYFQGFTHDEIAKALSIPLGTVKTRIRTALIQLKEML